MSEKQQQEDEFENWELLKDNVNEEEVQSKYSKDRLNRYNKRRDLMKDIKMKGKELLSGKGDDKESQKDQKEKEMDNILKEQGVPYILERTTWKQVKSIKYEVAILPWGATEPHNYHLPYGTDSLETSKIIEISASKAWKKGGKVMVLPTIPLGMQNPGQIDCCFCLNTSIETQRSIINDILKSLNHQGIKKFILLNGHGGNNFKSIIRELQVEYKEMFIGLIEWFRLFDLKEYFEEKCDHAGEMETSIMMYFYPELVTQKSIDEEAGDGSSKSFTLKGLKKKHVWTPRNWNKVSKDTGVGNPKKASVEKGVKFLNDVTTTISEFLIELSNCNISEIYEK